MEHTGERPLERHGGRPTPRRSCARARSRTSRRCRACCPARSPTTCGSTTSATSPARSRRARLAQDVGGGRRPATRWSGTAACGCPAGRCSGSRSRGRSPTDAELLLADDVSSALDAATEIELWAALRERGTTVVGATSKRAALARADRVVVLVDGEVAEVGPWARPRAALEPPRGLIGGAAFAEVAMSPPARRRRTGEPRCGT